MKPLGEQYDVVVIGGGPAGMMAAASAAAGGARVLLLEKNSILGKKLLITGGGRCNVTNHKLDVREMLDMYQPEGKFLFSTFTQHGVQETIDWFAHRGITLKEENEGRLFPTTDKAQTIQQALVTELSERGVQVKKTAAVQSLTKAGEVFVVQLRNGSTVQATACIVATGGIARPETGSTGDGFAWLASLGHTIVPNSYALVPITLKHKWTSALSGIAITDCKLTLRADGKKHSVHRGKLLFTHVGVTGPTILNMSKTIGELLQYSDVVVHLNLFPDADAAGVDVMLTDLFIAEPNKKVRNALSALLPTAMVKALLGHCQIDGDTKCNSITRTERKAFGDYVQSIPLQVKGLLGKDKAVVSSGGVRLEEVHFKTMESRLVPGLFLTGDVLNINRPSGGYGLQLCWSTGVVAGQSAAQK